MSTFSPAERTFVSAARVARLATADGTGRPHVVPICFALVGGRLVTPLDEKPKEVDPTDLRRVRDIESNPSVAVVVDRYREDWAELAWVQIRGEARLVEPIAAEHGEFVTALEGKYQQYADHALGGRPIIGIEPGHVVSWGALDAT